MDFLSNLKKKTESKIILAATIILALNSFFFIERKSTNAFPFIFDNIKIHYLIYLLCFGFLGRILWKYFKNKKYLELIKISLLSLLPTEIIFILGLYIIHTETKAHFIFYFLTGFYLVIAGLFFVETKNEFLPSEKISTKKWLRKQGASTLLILFMAISTFSYFGIKNIANYAGVDEPLWTFDRIPYFWKNVAELDWKNTSISDKPGITVVEISGIGLLFNNPLDYAKLKSFDLEKDIHQMNLAFRLPLMIFCILSLILFFILIQKLLDRKTALIATILISTSPMLIGMSRIINPDAILWIFAPLTILSYLIFLKEKTRDWLYLTGILLGLAILTKYVANILYIFFFGLIFLEYLFKKEKESLSRYLKKSFTEFFSLVLISLITFFFLFPETWVNLKKLFTGTILSQAFVSIAPLFIFLALILIADIFALKNKITRPILNFLIKYRNYLTYLILGIFLFFVFFSFFNTYLNMPWVNFEAVLSSPKSSYRTNSFLAIFSANFYPLIFASLPIVIIGLMGALLTYFKDKEEFNSKKKSILYFITFILLYYFATTFNEVVSTIRYQVILYPLLLIISALGIIELIKQIKYKYSFPIISTAILLIGLVTLSETEPHYLGYASNLLPAKYVVDVKDMGDGSYEVAQYLNSLPDAENLFIWTDKRGVCDFFVGKCDSFYDTASFEKSPIIDYLVISASRKNKITNETRSKESLPYDFEKIYNSPQSEYSIFIGNREKNYLKVLKAENFKK